MRHSTSRHLTSGKWILLIALLTSVALFTTACSEDEGITGGDSATFQADDIHFFHTDVGDTDIHILEIDNIGSGDLTLRNLQVHNHDDDVFSLFDPWENVTVAPNETHEVYVEYAPTAEEIFTGHISVETNDPDNRDATIEITTDGFQPEISVSPQSMNFQTAPGTSQSQIVEIRNYGRGMLDIDDIYIAQGSSDYSIGFFDSMTDSGDPPPSNDDSSTPPAQLEEGGAPTFMRVTFHPDDESGDEGGIPGEIIIESTDPHNSNLALDMMGNGGDGCIAISDPNGIDFGLRSIQEANFHTLTIENCSSEEELEIYDLTISDDGGGVFSVREDALPVGLPDAPHVLLPGQVTTALIGYAPDEETTHSGELIIESNAGINQELPVDLQGEGVDAGCPIASVGGSVDGLTAPSNPVEATNQDLVHLDSSGSSDPEGGSLDYEWDVIYQPDGSQNDVSDSSAQNPTFEVDIVGNFMIELTVYNDFGIPNCEPAVLDILAAPDEDVHIQLVWHTPNVDAAYGGPIPDAGVGTDLDLHYVRPGGSWGDAFDSVYWTFDQQDWTGDGQNNVFLDIDDYYGADPENINHADPETGAHPVGVHYYDDKGYGAAVATVRIYFGTLLVEQMTRTLDETDHFWYVGDVVWGEQPTFQVIDGYATSHSLDSANDGIGGF